MGRSSRRRGKKLNKLKVAIVVAIIMLPLTITVFGRYIYNSVREAYLSAKQFYFTSDILTVNGAHYQYGNWGGVDVYPIEFELYSYNSKLAKLDYDLDYTVTCSTSDTDKIKCTVGGYGEGATNTSLGTIYADTNTKNVIVYITPIATIEKGETVTIEVTASTSVPYQKTISCEFTLKRETIAGLSYEIQDTKNSDYAIFKLTNVNPTATTVTLTFDPRKLRLDLNDDIYLNCYSESTKVMEIDGKDYVKEIVFDIEAETTRYVKFYKVDKAENYTYPVVNDTSEITITT